MACLCPCRRGALRGNEARRGSGLDQGAILGGGPARIGGSRAAAPATWSVNTCNASPFATDLLSVLALTADFMLAGPISEIELIEIVQIGNM